MLLFRTRIVQETRNPACLHSFVKTGEAAKWGVRCCMIIYTFAIGLLLGTIEQLNKCGTAPCPIFPDIKIVSIDSHRSQMSHHRHELALQSYGLRLTCGSLRMIKAREYVSSSVNSSYLLWGFCPPPSPNLRSSRKTLKTQKH